MPPLKPWTLTWISQSWSSFMPVSWVYDGLGFREDIAIQPPSQWFLFPLRHLQASWTGRMEMETGTLSCGVPSATGGWWCLMQPAGPCNTAAFKWDCCLWYVTHSHKTHSTHQRHCSLGRGGCSSLTLHWDCLAQCTTHALSQVLDWKKDLREKIFIQIKSWTWGLVIHIGDPAPTGPHALCGRQQFHD